MSSPKVVLVTGANTGIGYETVKALLQSDKAYHVLLGSRSMEKAKLAIETLRKECPESANTVEGIQIDLTSDESIEKAFEHVKASPGHIDALINNGGATFDIEFVAGKVSLRECFNKTYDVNIAGTQVMTWTFMPLLLKSADPRLLFVAGLSQITKAAEAYFPTPPLPAGWPKQVDFESIGYRCSKTALNMLMLDWNHKMKEDGVKVWGVGPGFLATNLGNIQEKIKEMGGGHPSIGGKFLKRVVEGERDADVDCFSDFPKPKKIISCVTHAIAYASRSVNATKDEIQHHVDLPNETWLNIISVAPVAALYNLCLTSKWLCDLAQPFLYQGYVQPAPPTYKSFRPFIRTLLARPDLASRIKSLVVYAWNDQYGGEEIKDNPCGEEIEDSKGKRAEWQRTQDDQIQRLIIQLWSGVGENEDEVHWSGGNELVLLCSLTPNLEKLVLDLPSENSYNDYCVKRAKLVWGEDRPFLQKLSTIQFNDTGREGSFGISDIATLLELSSLQTLLAHRYDDTYGLTSFDPGTLNITQLTLVCCVVTEYQLEELIDACKALKSFHFVLGGTTVGTPGEIDFRYIGDALRKHESTLETLIFDIEEGLEEDSRDSIGSIGPFSTMKKLRHLDLPEGAYYGRRTDRVYRFNRDGYLGHPQTRDSSIFVEKLPPSLESLVVRVCSRYILPIAWDVFHRREGEEGFLDLKELAIHGEDIRSHEGAYEELLEPKDAFRNKGVVSNPDKLG